jgi:uncharacterized protein YbjT (DUF2867 family)/tryptophan-rich sensory protein
MISGNDNDLRPLILLTGATGYVGTRLLGALRQRNVKVRCLARRPEALESHEGAGIEMAAGDVLDVDSLRSALRGVHTAYYLIHSMDAYGDFEDLDRRAAQNFAQAAAEAGVRRIVYLGGLADNAQELSPHLRSRHEVGEILRSGGAQVIEFRASVVIGPGSLSFEMIRALVERLPVMIAPRWVSVPAQPIAIDDLIEYLVAALDIDVQGHRTFEIGGADRVSYGDLMKQYARQRGLRRLIIPVPVLTPRLSSLWLGLVTPLYARVGRKLIDSIRHPSVVQDDAASKLFPIRPLDHRRAIAAALASEDAQLARCGAAAAAGAARFVNNATRRPAVARFFDARSALIDRAPEQVYAVIERIGGQTGWYYGDWLWRLRGAMDRAIGGVGMRRTCRRAQPLKIGDTVDCWRVAAVEPARRLRLAAEMKLPGRAWLEFEIEQQGTMSRLRQTAVFDPRGIWGRLYWYLIGPLHQVMFAGMLRGIVAAGLGNDAIPPARHERKLLPRILMLLWFLILCFAAAALGAAWTASSVDTWYQTIAKPTWNPPDWVFGPVWTALYAMMAVAAWLVWLRGPVNGSWTVWQLFTAQLALNVAWSGIFFGLCRPGLAFFEVLLLWAAIAATMIAFGKRSKPAGWLFAPYLAWVSFAAALNFAIWRLNA